jgi:hypothetical protein
MNADEKKNSLEPLLPSATIRAIRGYEFLHFPWRLGALAVRLSFSSKQRPRWTWS